MVLPLLHGPLGEDGTVQGLLELADVPYVGAGVLGSALAMDKAMAKAGARRPRHPPGPLRAAFLEHELTAGTAGDARRRARPARVREAGQHGLVGRRHQGQDASSELADAIAVALSYDEWVVVEEAVVGREIEVAVLGNAIAAGVGAGEIVPGHEFYDYDDKYLDDGAKLLDPGAARRRRRPTRCARWPSRCSGPCACEGMARIDFFYEEGGRGFLCNEVNTMPGFTPISMYPKLWQATGVGLRRAHRRARAPGPRAPRPPPPQHRRADRRSASGAARATS